METRKSKTMMNVVLGLVNPASMERVSTPCTERFGPKGSLTRVSATANKRAQAIHFFAILTTASAYNCSMVRSAIQEDALSFLKEGLTAVVATVGEEGPRASVVYYDVDESFNIFFLTKTNTHKNIDIAFNPRMALVVGFGPEKLSVQLQGDAHILLKKEKQEAVASMLSRYTKKGIDVLPIEHLADLRDKHTVVVKVKPRELTFLNMEGVRYPRSQSNTLHRISFERKHRSKPKRKGFL